MDGLQPTTLTAPTRQGWGAIRLSSLAIGRAFGDAEGQRLLIISSAGIHDHLEVVGDGGYAGIATARAGAEDVPEILGSLVGRHHVFVITSDATFRSPPAHKIGDIKLGVLPLYSTGFSWSKLEVALRLIEAADFVTQLEQSRRLLAALDASESLLFLSEPNDAALALRPWAGLELHFFNQSGPIGWGHQSVLPGGEVSLLTDSHGHYSSSSNFMLDGDLVVSGVPVLHRGTCPCWMVRSAAGPAPEQADLTCQIAPSVTDRRLQEIFEGLEPVARMPALLRIRGGYIEDVVPLGHSSTFESTLEGLFREDDRYRKVHEIGFGLNPDNTLEPGVNFLPNEMVSGVHFGLGLTPFTEFHLDLVCPRITVMGETRTGWRHLLGRPGGGRGDGRDGVPRALESSSRVPARARH